MRLAEPRYPVDRYLVESSKKIEMVNIIDDEIWNPEPALRPDEEIILRKLHDMLQSTADDLKLLSEELASFHQPRVQVKSQPTPLDEEFNEKVHIEEVVNAKFHGYKIVDKSQPISSESKPKNEMNETIINKLHKTKVVNAGTQVNPDSSLKKSSNKNLQISRTKVVQIKQDHSKNSKEDLLNNGTLRKDIPKVHYNEISYKYNDPKPELKLNKILQVQKMPEVNIRSELKEQKVLQLDIMPEVKDENATLASNKNVGVISVQHEAVVETSAHPPPKMCKQYSKSIQESHKPPVRITTKMSTCDSSESTCNNVSSDAQHRINLHKQLKHVLKNSPKSSARNVKYKNIEERTKKDQGKRPNSSLEEWKRKLNAVYGQPSSSKNVSSTKTKKMSPKKSNITYSKQKSNILNNAEYIPYSHLTIGGARASDIEKEISELPNKMDIPLSPILDKILSSRENSFHNDSPKRHKDSPKVLTTSDENLLQEVIDIQKKVNKTVKKIEQGTQDDSNHESEKSDNPEGNSYADDFEDEKSEHSDSCGSILSKKSSVSHNNSSNGHSVDKSVEEGRQSDIYKSDQNASETNIQNRTYTKVLNLSFKDSVDVFEFVHSVDTQETGTQSNSTNKNSLKETQTSPRHELSDAAIQPIHNDLWPSIDPKGEVENMFQLEKEFIKKLILDEYGVIIEKNINKPSTSHDKEREDRRNNVSSFQKNTQTSPAHVKSVMTSPTRTKTRTTSPFRLSLTVDRQTSPLVHVTQDEEFRIEIDNEVEDLGISINLSSPRFSLRLPQNSREVLSNLDNHSLLKIDQKEFGQESKSFRKHEIVSSSSSSSIDADNSSEISSLGEVKMKLKKKLKKSRFCLVSESSSSSLVSRYSSDFVSADILPLKSEGEVSLGQVVKKPSRRKRKESDGELAL